MLSIKPLSAKNIKSLVEYYFRKEFKDAPAALDAHTTPQWTGLGADKLNLHGEVTPERFKQLLTGLLPNGVQLGIVKNGEHKHRPGFDLTFSAPKSFSIATLVGERWDLLDLHKQAVNRTLELIERLCAQARKTVQGDTTFENTENSVIATFLQCLSRSDDPDIHTHCVVMNSTLRNDNCWRALASNFGGDSAQVQGFFERVCHFKHYFGMIYRAELAFSCKHHGLDIHTTHANYGFFELTCLPQELLALYQTRRDDIEAYMEEHGVSGAKAAALATLATRPKQNEPRDYHKCQEKWQEKAQSLGINVRKALESQPVSSVVTATQQTSAHAALEVAIAQASQQTARISHVQLLSLACQFSLPDPPSLSALEQAVKQACASGQLITLPALSNEIPSYTTRALIESEQQLLHYFNAGKTLANPMADSAQVRTFIAARSGLTANQHRALNTLLQIPDRFAALTGPAGSGKTALLPHLQAFAKQQKMRLFAITLKAADCDVLHDQTGVQTRTLSSLIKTLNRQLEKTQGRLNGRDCLFVLTQAQTVSMTQMQTLMDITHRIGGRLIYFADLKRANYAALRNPLQQLIQHQLATVILSPPVTGVYSHHRADLDHVHPQLIEINNQEQRNQAVIQHYTSLSPSIRNQTAVLLPSRKQADIVNQRIRAQLIGTGQLEEKHITLDLLIPQRLSPVQSLQARYYSAGQWLRFNEAIDEYGIDKGAYRIIREIDKDKQGLILMTSKGRHPVFYTLKQLPLQTIEIFNAVSHDIAVGEKIYWNRSNRDKALYTGQQLTVTHISNRTLTLRRHNGKLVKITRRHPQHRHFGLGYATTPWQLPHGGVTTVIAHQVSHHAENTQAFFYECTRSAKTHFYIYTKILQDYLHKLQPVLLPTVYAVIDWQ